VRHDPGLEAAFEGDLSLEDAHVTKRDLAAVIKVRASEGAIAIEDQKSRATLRDSQRLRRVAAADS
jgi:hypothetical protein